MASLTLDSSPEEPSRTYSDLLDRLSASPRPAAVWYDGDSGERVELSGRVLANWAVKLINLLSSEWEITPQTHLIVDMPPHWKAAAVHVAARALGPAAVRCDAAADPEQLVVTSDPQSWIAGGTEFDELAGVSLGLLDSSFEEAGGEPLPAWALDISAEVRQHPDQLVQPLEPVLCPGSAGSASSLLITQWDDAAAEAMVSTLAGGGTVVLFQGSQEGDAWQQMLRQEGLSGA
ncbi:TIGR03089 family protein [Nesterenkonia sp. NBAIMH1]|uniref:TIGR03089 family protein n=1 Tax=Nesterenkonia sp. NBAIMH1 TaxID=2600320 RepID=UPI0011B64A57|nr:TIGR03089 family protein [Nesterenkonia sp. NBAIMH1]